ncbi:unnamed protein product [Hyaloperonospora brassicae]|uniref:Uncharacterized protein n=1 Tax=Hyaloperonospora brassicae TaxID=162125 RepID=A0AAV0U403_HYABA|nr:unnamed protein product [Hyaloperonospora brassicae]
MLSDLEKDKSPSEKSDEKPDEPSNGGTPPPDAKEPTRAWAPRKAAPASGSLSTEDDSSSEKAATPAPEGPATVDRRRNPLAPPARDDDESSGRSGGGPKPEAQSKGTAALPSRSEFPTADAAMRQRRTRRQRKFIAFTKSPSLLLATPVPDAVRTADDDDDESKQADKTGSTTQEEVPETPLSNSKASGATSESQPGVVYPAGSKMAKLAENRVPSTGSEEEENEKEEEEEEEEATPPSSGLASNSSAKGVLPKSSIEAPRDAPPSGSLTDDDPVQESRSALVESSPPSAASPPSASPASSSSTAAMADKASGDKSVTSNTLVLGLMMAGAVALVVLVGVFVYIKSAKNKGEADPVLFPVHRQDPNLGGPMARSLSATADYHKDKNMTPAGYGDDDFFASNALHGQPKYDPDLDMFPPRASTALTQSQMSLPPMAQTGQSMASSEFSQYTTQSNFYGENSAYTSATASTMDKYASYRPGEREDDMAEYSEGESDFGGESMSDMASTNNDWNAAVHERAPGSRVDHHHMMGASQFDASNSRSTSASAYTGKTQFMESEYTEYRMSRDNGHSHAQSSKGYDTSFAPSDGTYDGRYDGGKSFTSSGFSEY